MPQYIFDPDTNLLIQKALATLFYTVYYKGTVDTILGLPGGVCPLPSLRRLITNSNWVVVIQKRNGELAYVLRVVKEKRVPTAATEQALQVLKECFPIELGELD